MRTFRAPGLPFPKLGCLGLEPAVVCAGDVRSDHIGGSHTHTATKYLAGCLPLVLICYLRPSTGAVHIKFKTFRPAGWAKSGNGPNRGDTTSVIVGVGPVVTALCSLCSI